MNSKKVENMKIRPIDKLHDFQIGPHVIAGNGALKSLEKIMVDFNFKRPIIITDSNIARTGLIELILNYLPASEIYSSIEPDPDVDSILKVRDKLIQYRPDCVIAIGGGSSIDSAKLGSLLAMNNVDLLQLADNWTLAGNPGIFLINIPTTVGSGSEMTRGAVFKDLKRGVKRVIVSDLLFARFVILDPSMVKNLPEAVIVSTGMDAFTQAIEGVMSRNSSEFTDALNLHALAIIRKELPEAVKMNHNFSALEKLQGSAAMVGAAMAFSGVGAAHALANTLGGHYRIPHGVACSIVLKPVVKYNLGFIPDSKLMDIAAALGIISEDNRDYLINEIYENVATFVESTGFSKRLREFGMPEVDIEGIASEAMQHSDMESNPVSPDKEDIAKILREVY